MNLWQYSTLHKGICKVIEEKTLWGQTVCRVWLPNDDVVVCVPKSALQRLDYEFRPQIEANRIAYVAAAAKVADVLEGSSTGSDGHILLAPMESNVIPLPHQIHALSRAISGDRVRYLLADEVGLGKTIEAGLIMRELKLRGLVRRILVVAPKGLATQWVAEMKTHFNEQFQLVLGDDIGTLQRMASASGPRGSAWTVFDQVIVSLDSVKPMDRRRGWTSERVNEYNRSRFEDLITAGWDLVVIDEAHRMGGSTDLVARYKLGKGLAEAAPYVLLLSATPHQGKSDAFHRLMNLLDGEAFPDLDSVSRDLVAPYVIRTEKRKALDADGRPIFKPRRTQMVPVAWASHHHLQQLLYETVTDYVREGYNQSLRENKRHFGFLMILMQRLVVSSTRAIKTTLERRLNVLRSGLLVAGSLLEDIESQNLELETFYDMDGQEQLDEIQKVRVSALKNEESQVKTLLDTAIRCEQACPDAKAEALMDWIYRLQAEENDPELKVLIFTEFVPTQQMLKEFLEARGISVAVLSGSMDMEERKKSQDAFRNTHRVLISTDAGGEGLNLQFAHIIINYDIPWNPMRLEQRIGRVDRIGQQKTVRAINLVFEDSVEFRVRQVLEQKLSVIFDEFGIDKTGDVLDSAQAGELFEDVFTSAILDAGAIEKSVDHTVAKIREEIQLARQTSTIHAISDEPDLGTAQRLRSHPLPYWLERMTISYLNSHGGHAQRKRSWWDLSWPDGEANHKVVFNLREQDHLQGANLLNLENSKVRGLALNLPQVASGQPLPCVTINGLSSGVSGLWGLIEIRIQAGPKLNTEFLRIPRVRRGFMPVFLSEDGKLFLPTARHIWDTLQTVDVSPQGRLSLEESANASSMLLSAAEQAGKELFASLLKTHNTSLEKEKERGRISFTARRRAIEKVGLPEVRQFRTSRCDSDEEDWKGEILAAAQIIPEIRPLIMFKIVKGGISE